MNKFYGPFKIFNELLSLMVKGKSLPLDRLHISGSRSCSKTFSVEDFINKALISVKGFGALAIRQEVSMAEELFTEYMEMNIDNYNGVCNINKSKRTLSYGRNKLVVKGLKSNTKNTGIKKAGLAKFRDAKYIVLHAEEAFEIDMKDKTDIKQSLRSNKDTQILEINTCNPANIGNPYISYMNKYFKFDEQELKTKGYQWSGIIDIENKTPNGIVKTKEAFLYVNWRVVQEIISPYVIKDIQRTWQLDPQRAKVIDWGMPGDTLGAIFGDLIRKIQPSQILPNNSIRIGIDYGWGTSGNRSPTVAWFMGINTQNQGITLFERYHHDNKIELLDSYNQIERLLQWAWKCREVYITKRLINRKTNIDIMFDNAHVGVIAILQKAIRDKAAINEEWNVFTCFGCDTKNVITKITQIETFKMCLAAGLVSANFQSQEVKNGIAELTMITWEDEKEEKMNHEHSHDFDAIIYGTTASDLMNLSQREPQYFLRRKQWLNT